MWHHFCPCERAVIGVQEGEPCNWCDVPRVPADDERAPAPESES